LLSDVLKNERRQLSGFRWCHQIRTEMASIWIVSMLYEMQKPLTVTGYDVRKAIGPQFRTVPLHELVPFIALPSKGHGWLASVGKIIRRKREPVGDQLQLARSGAFDPTKSRYGFAGSKARHEAHKALQKKWRELREKDFRPSTTF